MDIAKTKASLARAKQQLQLAYRSADLQEITKRVQEVDGFTKGLEIAEQAFAQLFPAA